MHSPHMPEYHLNLGELVATREAAQIACYGLGSCVGLFLYDRLNRVGAGAHIVLSGELERDTTANAHTAFAEMLKEISKLGGNIGGLRAKVAGGASLFGSSLQIGERNVRTIEQLLLEHKVYVAAKDVGGHSSRSVFFHTLDGSLSISAGHQKYII